MTKLVGALAVSLALVSTQALAWDGQGHMTVAALAWSEMTPAAKSKAADLLKRNPMYSGWVKGLSHDDARAETAFIEAATWPDLIKRQNSGYKFDGEHSTKPQARQNTGYGDKLQHRYWHFIDMPFSPDGTPLRQPEPPNAKDRIALFRQTLLDPGASDALKSYDMVWLIHLVGDVHQPLHATSRFTATMPSGDNGGNSVKCSGPARAAGGRAPSKATNPSPCRELHGYWDGLLGDTGKLNIARQVSTAKRTAAALPKPLAAQANIADEGVWINESLEAAEKYAYAAPIGVGAGPFAIDAAYQKKAVEVAQERAALAGARLANLLNDALK